jgi:hypothetical protein
MSKIVLVETVSTFRHMYAVELKEDEPIEYALDSVVVLATNGTTKLEEFAQKHIAEDVFSHREINEEEYLKIFDQENEYLNEWTPEQKKQFIYKEVSE